MDVVYHSAEDVRLAAAASLGYATPDLATKTEWLKQIDVTANTVEVVLAAPTEPSNADFAAAQKLISSIIAEMTQQRTMAAGDR